MKKISLVSISSLLFCSLFLIGCQYEAIISTSEARSRLQAIYATQEGNDELLSFAIDEMSVTSSEKDETIENAHYQFIVDEENTYFHYLVYITNNHEEVITDYEYFAFIQGETYYTAINRLTSDGQYEKFYYTNQASDAYVNKNYASLINLAVETYQGTDYQILFLDEESGLLASNVNLDYTYFDIQASSSRDDSLTIKYRLIDQEENTIVNKVSWKSSYLSYTEYQFSNANDYVKTITNFSTHVELEYPLLSDYILNN